MKTLKLLAMAMAIFVLEACTQKSDGTTDSQMTNQDSTAAPGVGAAPDNSRDADVDSTRLPLDTASVSKP
ncbi:MAG: hypothetical protein ABJA70_20315 [Chryseolinea sp.]